MQEIKQCARGEDKKMTVKQWNKICFLFCSFPKFFFQTMWSCDKRGLSTFYFPLIWRRLDCQSIGGKVNFLLDLDLASNREKVVRTQVSVHRDTTNAQRNCWRIEGAGAWVSLWGLPEECLALEAGPYPGAHWVGTAFLKPHETHDRSAVTLICSPLFLS